MKIRMNLSARISMGYLFIIVVALLATLFCIGILVSNKNIDNKIKNAYLPSYLLLKDLNSMSGDTKKLSNNWVYQPKPEEKEKLKVIHAEEYPLLKTRLEDVIKNFDDDSDKEKVQTSITAFDEIVDLEKKLMTQLSADSLYSNDVAIDAAIILLDKKITPKVVELSEKLNTIIGEQETKMNTAQEEKQWSYTLLRGLLITMIILFVIAAFLAYMYSKKSIIKPLIELKDIITQLSLGKVVNVNLNERNDEIGEMTMAIGSLMEGINVKSNFAGEIGKGNYDQHFELLSEDDGMGRALLNMRDSLKKNAEEDKKREWGTVGIAKFAEILRSADDLDALSDSIISNLVKYTNANQGHLFVVNDDNKDHLFLELKASYAWNKKKHLNKKIEKGEGLTGQSWQEADMIFMTDVPNDYIEITSGLGGANPKCILIVPLKMNGVIYGVLEIASFNVLQNHEVSFVEKLAENIASTVSVAKINTRTKKLLEDSQRQEEALRSQEEEMRQNMEEMLATQEEMQRKEGEMKKMVADLKQGEEHSRSQEEEMRQNMEEMQATQEEMQRKEGEMKKMVSDLKEGEERSRSQEEEMRQNMEEMQATQEEMQRKEAEAKKIMLDLKQSEEHARAQEEELRQNIEEMTASQEEVLRFQKETEAQMNIINRAAIVSKANPLGQITFANDEFCRIAQYTREELMGKNHNILRHPDMPAAAFADLWKTISSGKVWRGQVKNKAKDGSHYWVDATIAPIMGENGKPKEYMAVRHLITDWKDMEEELKLYKEGKKK